MNTPLPEKSVEERVDDLARKIRRIIDGGGDFIFRGESKQKYDKTDDLICSSLARDYPLDSIKSDDFSLEEDVQKEELKNIEKYTDAKDEEKVLIEVQHYGGKTSLIDFTEDYNVALFFACDSDSQEDGRIVLFDISKKPEDIRVIYPEKSLTNRIISQKSVFLRLFKRNYLHKKDGENDFIAIIPVPSDLKPEIIRRLGLHHNIKTESVYYDIHGYIRNQSLHRAASVWAHMGRSLARKENDKKAIEYYTESIRLNPHNASTYGSRGIAYFHLGNYDRSIADLSKQIELAPKNVTGYYNRGLFKKIAGYTESARKDLVIALEISEGKYYSTNYELAESIRKLLSELPHDSEK